jgi:hypothetical protein
LFEAGTDTGIFNDLPTLTMDKLMEAQTTNVEGATLAP